MAMDWQKQCIEEIRRKKYFVGGAEKNPLAPELHKAIKQLSVELYQNETHFIKEIIQNAEDNIYGEGVIPCLEFLLTKEDIAEVGASTTLIVFNNEEGLRTLDVEALCSVASSTKTGKRHEGFIGSKGIGFKSVFTVCETAIIISNGYRIRFRAEPSEEARVGYIVPEWTECPSDDAIKAAYGGDQLPMTVIILPIHDGKDDLVRKQLKELSPEIILFLSRIRELKILDKTKNASTSGELLRITRSQRISGITSSFCECFTVTLKVESSEKVTETHSYCIFQQSVPVTHPVQERQEMKDWAITLAFPHEGRPSHSIGDVFSFLPTELRTGFPFIINADFILTSSRESIRFDSKWNLGILDCIPAAFHLAFEIMLSDGTSLQTAGVTLDESHLLLDDIKDVYKYLPCNDVENAYRCSSACSDEQRQVRQKLHVQSHQAGNLHQLEKVRGDILHRLAKASTILLSGHTIGNGPVGDSYVFCPEKSLQIKLSFRTILESAAQCNHPAPFVVYYHPDGSRSPARKFAIVDGYVQQFYAAGLSALGVPHMTAAEYKGFLMDSDWLLALPEELYLDVLTFFAFEIVLLDTADSGYSSVKKTYRLLKIRGEKGAVELATFDEVSTGSEYFYTSSAEGADWLSAWVKEFNPWHSAKVMPLETSEALMNVPNGDGLMRWIRKHGLLIELNARDYSQKLMERLMVANGDPPTHGILVFQFLYCATVEKLLPWQGSVQRLQKLGHINVIDNGKQTRRATLKFRKEGGLLLPPAVSKWPILFDLSRGSGRSGQRLIALSDLYLDPQCSLAENIVGNSPGSGSMMEFIKESVNAIDLQSIEIPANETFPFCHPMTIQKSILLFEWLKVQLPNRSRTKKEIANDVLLRSLKSLAWMQTIHHGWQCPNSVFFRASDFSGHFKPHDLPFFDLPAYEEALDLTDSGTAFVLEELDVVTDVQNGGAAVANYFSTLLAEKLDQDAVTRFYTYLHKFHERDETSHSVKIWIPATVESKVPYWKAGDDCIIRDEDNVCVNNSNLSVLDKIYDMSLFPFFSGALRVRETAPIDLYVNIWLKWCTNHTQQSLGISKVEVHAIWKNILAGNCTKKLWESFLSKAWVPVGPISQELITQTLSIVPPSQAFIADDLRLSMSFSTIARGKLEFVWQLPGISSNELKSLLEFYSAMGVRKLSEFTTYDISIPANVWKKKIPWEEGFLCEGLFRSVSAYLCHTENKHGLSSIERQKRMSSLVFAKEVVVREPFVKLCSLQTETFTSTAIVTRNGLAYYDKVKGKLFYLARDHDLLQTEVAKRDFSTQLAATISSGILPEHPELSLGLTTLLKLLYNSNFAMDSVKYELREQNLVIWPEDEKVLMENMAVRQQQPNLPEFDLWDPPAGVTVPSPTMEDSVTVAKPELDVR